ncbi:MAG: hypothetical protein MJ073_04515 [Oscillibacter sp.]|nr:hypothetical protein [Oscillibacter sp.]
MKNRWFLRLTVLLLISGILNTTVSLAVQAGSSQDPLITLSYLNDTFMGEILKKVDSKISARNADIAKQTGSNINGSSADSFTVVTMTKGQTLTGDIGCEVMLRIGTASCVTPSAPGLIDETSGGTLNNGGALVTNHLYMMTIEGRGVKATADTTKVLVRGTYTVA